MTLGNGLERQVKILRVRLLETEKNMKKIRPNKQRKNREFAAYAVCLELN